MNDVEVFDLDCPSCGASLEVAPGLARFACAFCGDQLEVRRQGGTVWIEPLVRGLAQVQHGVNLAASELAIDRLQKELWALTRRRDEVGEFVAAAGSERAKAFVLGLFFVTVSGCLLASNLLIDANVPTSALTIPLAIAFLLFVYYRITRGRTATREIELSALNKMIEKKKSELAFHRNRVSP